MQDKQLYPQAVGLKPPLRVVDVNLDTDLLVISLAAFLFLGAAAPVTAQVDSTRSFADRWTLSTFGGWSVGQTSDNLFLDGSPDGEVENAFAGVNIQAAFTSKVRMVGQLEVVVDPEESETELDYGFLAWTLNDTFELRGGRVKHAYGIYSEIFDLGTLRPFPQLPQSIYGPTGIAGENLDGLELETRYQWANGWELEQVIYGGKLQFDAFEPWELFRDEEGDGGLEDELFERKVRKEVVGARWLLLPSVRLNLGLSVYTGKLKRVEQGVDSVEVRHTAIGVHAEYLADRWSIRGEVAHLDEEYELQVDSYYLEALARWNRRWQIAAMLDAATVDVEEVETAPFSSLEKHRDTAVGINYLYSEHLVFKLAFHHVRGNRFAFPEGGLGETSVLDETTRLLQFAVQFAF